MAHPLLHIANDKNLMESLAEEYGTPLYVYSAQRISENIQRFNNALQLSFNKYHLCYAVKANNNPNLVSYMKSQLPLLGGDCSSPGELCVVKQAGMSGEECIYSGNYESAEDLQSALSSNAWINLDDITSFDRLKRIGLPKRLSFRINPGFGKGTFSQVVTGGKDAKFGVPKEKIVEAYRTAAAEGIARFGLHCMTGSGVLEKAYFENMFNALLAAAREIEAAIQCSLEFISVGGGFGIPYKNEEPSLNIEKVMENLSTIFYQQYPDRAQAPSFWCEPGKFLVGDAGILLTKVTGLKEGYRNFIGLDAGMETLMRPGLYGAYHRIYKVGDVDAEHSQVVDITGRICENTDRLAVDRPFPKVGEGDLVGIMDVGAYGYAMAHQFNTRPRPAEVLLHENHSELIRKRETVEDIFQNCNV